MIQGSHTVGQEMYRAWYTHASYMTAHSLVDASEMVRRLFG